MIYQPGGANGASPFPRTFWRGRFPETAVYAPEIDVVATTAQRTGETGQGDRAIGAASYCV